MNAEVVNESLSTARNKTLNNPAKTIASFLSGHQDLEPLELPNCLLFNNGATGDTHSISRRLSFKSKQ
jgi:hypothetical protein